MKQVFVGIFFCISITTAFTQTDSVQSDSTETPSNLMLSEVYMNEQTDVEKLIKSDDSALVNKLLDSIYINHQSFYPPVLFAASKAAYDLDKKYMASFFFYLAQLKTKIDVNFSKVPDAKNTYKTLTQIYGQRIENFCLQRKDSFQTIVMRVLDICDSHEGKYDHRWIALHGSLSKLNKPYSSIIENDIIRPKEEWATIKLKTLNEYYVNFISYLEENKK